MATDHTTMNLVTGGNSRNLFFDVSSPPWQRLRNSTRLADRRFFARVEKRWDVSAFSFSRYHAVGDLFLSDVGSIFHYFLMFVHDFP